MQSTDIFPGLDSLAVDARLLLYNLKTALAVARSILDLRDALEAQSTSLTAYLDLFANDTDVVPGTSMTKAQILTALESVAALDAWASTDPDPGDNTVNAPRVGINAIGVLHTPG